MNTSFFATRFARRSCHPLGPGILLEVKNLTSSSFFAVSNAGFAPIKVQFTIRGEGYRALAFCKGAVVTAMPSHVQGKAAGWSGQSSAYKYSVCVPVGRAAMVCAIVANADALSVFFECEADVQAGGVGSVDRRDGQMSMALGEAERRDVLRKTARMQGMGVVASGNLLVVNQGNE